MKRNLLLVLGFFVGVMLVINSTKRLLTFKSTSEKVAEAQKRLEQLRKENEQLKEKLEYTKTDEFKEKEIRDKLGLSKEGEAVVVLPKEDSGQSQETGKQKQVPNWQKWRNLFFGG